MAHRFHDEDDEGCTKVKVRVKPKTPKVKCCLKISLSVLKKTEPPEMSCPQQLATFSTTVRAKWQEPPPQSKSNPPIKHHRSYPTVEEYTVHQPFRRTLWENDYANCKYLGTPKTPLDLNRGYGTEIQKNDKNEFMSLLLLCLTRRGLIGKSEFVCWRNLLTGIGSTPYEIDGQFDNGMIVAVQKIDDVFYMFEFPTQESLVRQANLDRRQKQMIYGGMKFESYMTGTSGPLNLNHEFCSVVESKIGTHSIIYRGEIDCRRADGCYVELKTSREFGHPAVERSFYRDKLIKWWLQSSLLNVPEIVCGFRDDNGIVRSVQKYQVAALPEMMQQRKPSVCMAFLDIFLDFVKANVKLEYIPHVFKRQVKSASFEMTLDMEGKYKFIPYGFAVRR